MADLEMIKGGDFLFLSLPFFFISFFLLLSSQKWRGRGSRGAPLIFGVSAAFATINVGCPRPRGISMEPFQLFFQLL